MSASGRPRGIRVLKAVSSPIRLAILNLLFDRGSLSYTELMSALKMNPGRDAGRFAYHLKFLLKTDLVEADVESKKYHLTSLGKMVIEVADSIERSSVKRKRILVRTSHFSLEEFDQNRIVDSLMKEATMPVDLAQKVAKEAERRLLKSKTKYLTAPLVREVVNGILIEKNLEEFRHKLTRLGLPVHEAKSLIEAKRKASHNSVSIQEEAGKLVIKEYTLLNVLPRDIADAHLSGSLHICGLSYWIQRPSEIVHDLRFFLRSDSDPRNTDTNVQHMPPPKKLQSALTTTLNVALNTGKEISKTQTFEYFNLFLAPYAKGLDQAEIKENLRLFVHSVSQHVNASLCIEATTPEFIANTRIEGPPGIEGDYQDFSQESQKIGSLLLQTLNEEKARRPLLNPKIIMKIRPETLNDDEPREILLQAHRLASEKSISYFANLNHESAKHSVFSTSGLKLMSDFSGDWETDTLRTGNIGTVLINLPRIAHQCEKEEKRFFEILRERLEMAARALEIKLRFLRQWGRNLNPFLMQKANGDHYFRLKFASSTISPVGLMDAAETFCGEKAEEDKECEKFAEKTKGQIADFALKTGKRRRRRLSTAALPNYEASRRLASLDIEMYGFGKVRFSGTREEPYYSSSIGMSARVGSSSNYLGTPDKTYRLNTGGPLTVVELGPEEYAPEVLVQMTRRLVQEHGVEFFTYRRELTFCGNCGGSWSGLLHKCPGCGVTNNLTHLNKLGD